jgi:deoxyribodipyrimidine photo-lyase
VSAHGQGRERRLAAASTSERMDLVRHPGVTVIPPAALRPAGGGDRFQVFTPYWRQWRETPRRAIARAPRRLTGLPGLRLGRLPPLSRLVGRRRPSPERPKGGEQAGRARLEAWLRSGLADYGASHDDLAADGTSRLSPFLHFGCLSPLEVTERVSGRKGAEPYVRQLSWRDFFHQLLAADPAIAREDMRPRGNRWRTDDDALEAWRAGRTGYPLVDAGMRQLAREGWMHNRARLVVASFLTKDLYLNWRLGARHFSALLVDGDVASNTGNWQWVAGTGADTRPNRIFNPTRQALRLDPHGDYVRRYVPELADVEGGAVHEPWRLGLLRPGGYPEPIVDHAVAADRFRRARS